MCVAEIELKRQWAEIRKYWFEINEIRNNAQGT